MIVEKRVSVSGFLKIYKLDRGITGGEEMDGMDLGLRDKVALVTGASKGIGRPWLWNSLARGVGW